MQNTEHEKRETRSEYKILGWEVLEGKSHIINQGMHKIILKLILKERDVTSNFCTIFGFFLIILRN